MPSITHFRQRLTLIASRPLIRRTLLGLGIFLALFTLFGYGLLPGIIKSQAESLIAEKLHRHISIDKVEVSPYALAVRILDVKLMEPDGVTLFASFDELKVDVSAESLFQLAPVVQEVRLVKPYVHLARIETHRYNIDGIIDLIFSQPASDTQARFSVHNIQVDSGRIEFEDRPEKTTHTVNELALGIPFVSSLPSEVAVFVEPSLSAKVNGTPLLLKGKARPFGESKDAQLELNFESLDLTRYLEYLPYQPRFKLPSAKLDLQLTASFRQIKGKAPALVLKGLTRLKSVLITDLKGKPLIKLPELAITLGEADVFSSHYGMAKVVFTNPELSLTRDKSGGINLAALAPPPPAKANHKPKSKSGAAPAPGTAPAFNLTVGELNIRGGAFHFDDLQVARPLSVGVGKLDLTLSNMTLDLQKQMASVGEVSSGGAEFLVRMGAAAPPSSITQVKETSEATKKTFIFNVGRVTIDRWSARVEDQRLAQSVVTLLTPISLSAQNLSNAVGQPGTMELKAKVNQGGQLAIAGGIGMSPLHADLALDLKGVDILSLQPYLTDYVNLLVTRATLTTHGKLLLDGTPDGSVKGGFKGDLTLGNLATVDKVNANDFLRWKSLYLGGMDLQLTPFSLVMDQIALSDFFARVIVDANGRINLQDIQRNHPDEQLSLTDADARKTAKPIAGTAPPPAADKPAPIRIRKASLQGGRVRFTDNFIKPHYSATLEDLGGVISDLSSDASSAASLDLHGKVNSAPLSIAGKINPLKGDLFLDLKANVQGMELAPLSAYSGKYVGYGIEKGKLSFEVAYQVDQRKLTAQNRLILDQLTFGEKIESPTATSLPVQLAVALLRDRNGVIDISLPVGGSLDDPDFSVGGIIVKVIVNIITKAVTAPFALLGSLFGGGEELSWLEFDAGRYVVPPAGETKLQSLVKALQDRPALKLEIAGRVDPDSDREGLRRANIERKVRAMKLKDLVAKSESTDAASVVVKLEEYPALLTRVYRDEKFPKPRNVIGLQKDLPVDEMEKLLAANVQVSDDDLTTLASRRAQAVKDSLLKNGGVGAERLFIVTGKPSPASGEGSKAPLRRTDLFLR
ncbi:MAG: DUF748 domain-containing protein [Sterolibacterium sp.]|nr:DUF748 domain-containing protein [Sterolibacterium sp.]